MLTDKTVFQIYNIIIDSQNFVKLYGKRFLYYKSLYKYPLDSKVLNISVATNLSPEFEMLPVSLIFCKCFILQLKDKPMEFITLPLIHSLQ